MVLQDEKVECSFKWLDNVSTCTLKRYMSVNPIVNILDHITFSLLLFFLKLQNLDARNVF